MIFCALPNSNVLTAPGSTSVQGFRYHVFIMGCFHPIIINFSYHLMDCSGGRRTMGPIFAPIRPRQGPPGGQGVNDLFLFHYLPLTIHHIFAKGIAWKYPTVLTGSLRDPFLKALPRAQKWEFQQNEKTPWKIYHKLPKNTKIGTYTP